MHTFYVGWDSREEEAYEVCKASLEQFDVEVIPLKHTELRDMQLFDRPWKKVGNQWWDERDEKPFSTEFAHSRFLTPILAKRQNKKGLVAFCDCDFLFLKDPKYLFEECQGDKAIWTVRFNMVAEGLKMDNVIQQYYARKLWSSLMIFNLDSLANRRYSEVDVNYRSGTFLHGFQWLSNEDMGALDPLWNYVPGISSPPSCEPWAIHWSLGGPWMKGYDDQEYANLWKSEAKRLNVILK